MGLGSEDRAGGLAPFELGGAGLSLEFLEEGQAAGPRSSSLPLRGFDLAELVGIPFARLRCASCKGDHLIAFSCQTRNFCPSCPAKRSALFAERICGRILSWVPDRHMTITIPKALRGLFERDRSPEAEHA